MYTVTLSVSLQINASTKYVMFSDVHCLAWLKLIWVNVWHLTFCWEGRLFFINEKKNRNKIKNGKCSCFEEDSEKAI